MNDINVRSSNNFLRKVFLYMILGIVSTVLFLEEKWQIIGSLFIFFL